MAQAANPPHVLIFPLPIQGHVNSMLKLAELLGLSGIYITFLVSPDVHDRLLRHTNVTSRLSSNCLGFHLESLPFEIEERRPDILYGLLNFFDSLLSVGKPYLRELLAHNGAEKGRTSRPPITSIIADGLFSVVRDVAQELGVPFIFFRTVSACAFWAYFCIPQLIEAGELPFSGGDLDVKIANVKGMGDFLRRRDLPSICRGNDLTNPIFKLILSETLQTPRAQGLILNTFEDLEEPILSLLRTQCPNLYTIGPLHAHLKIRLQAVISTSTSASSNSLWEEDRSCINWLDEQPAKSVIYVSFGSIAKVTRDQLLEFWHGLVNSGTRFLWVVRPDSVIGKDGENKSTEELVLEEETKAWGYVAGWAPQEEVLAHQAVGGFLTHSGWNSTLESIVAGVPMICWPHFVDQQINSRFVEVVWKLGLDMKDTCDRVIVEKMVRDLMEIRRDEFLQRAEEMAKLAKNAISDVGSSYNNFNRLVEDIRLTSIPPSKCSE